MQKKEYKNNYLNPYINSKLKKEDVIFTRKKKKQYNFAKKLSNIKFFANEKSLAGKWLKKYKKKIFYSFMDAEFSMDYERKNYDTNKDYKGDVSLNSIIVYDLILKEDLIDYGKGLLNFSKKCKKTIGAADELSIKQQITTLYGNFIKGSLYDLGYFYIEEKEKISSLFEYISISVEVYGESFCMVAYRIKLTEKATQELNEILTSFVVTEPLFSKIEDKHRIVATKSFDLEEARRESIQNLIYHLEFNFLSFMKQYVPCFFDNHKEISPSLGVFVVNGLEDIDSLNKILGFRKNDYDSNTEKGVYINLGFNDINFNHKKIDSFIIDKSVENDFERLIGDFHYYTIQLCDYYIKLKLYDIISTILIRCQKRLNVLLSTKMKAKKLLVAKKETLQELFIFQRFVKDVVNCLTKNYFKTINKDFTNKTICEITKFKTKNAYSELQGCLLNKYKSLDEQIKVLFEYYDTTLKAVESSTNLSLVRTTLVITSISAIISLIALISSNIETIKDFINTLF